MKQNSGSKPTDRAHLQCVIPKSLQQYNVKKNWLSEMTRSAYVPSEMTQKNTVIICGLLMFGCKLQYN